MCRPSISKWLGVAAALLFCATSLLAAAAEPGASSSILLIASDRLSDPRFRQTVVLVTRHGRNRSAIGVIFNRALNVSLERLFPEQKEAASHRLHYGGPVAQGQLVYLVRTDVAPSASIALAERLYFGSEGGSLQQLLAAGTPVATLRVFNGFSSWAPNQLEREIERGDWYILPIEAEALFSEPIEDLWPKLWRRATQLRVQAPWPVPPDDVNSGGVRLAVR